MFQRKRRLRVHDENDLENLETDEQNGLNQEERSNIKCKPECLSRVFSEDYEFIRETVLDPESPAAMQWNKIFLASCLLSIFIDPLFLFSPYTSSELCVQSSDRTSDLVLTVLRSLLDVFYLINIVIQFRTAYVAPSSRVLGRGELLIDPWKIGLRYLIRDFKADFIAMLPVPQVVVWAVIPQMSSSAASLGKTAPRYCILLQLFLRLVLLYRLTKKISKATGAIPNRAWSGAAYNMILYYLLSNVTGGCYYLLSLQRLEACWRNECDRQTPACKYTFFDCDSISDPERRTWLAVTNVSNICDANNNQDASLWGIYVLALRVGATSAPFCRKFLYCFWWALQSLGSIGNNLQTSGNVVENIYTNLLAILGIILFALLLGNVQTYVKSSSKRLDEWKIKRAATERWMHHRQLDPVLRQSVRNYDQYKWVVTRGVEEEALLKDLPPNLRKKVNRHLWFNLVRQVPVFQQMDDNMLDAICEMLKPALLWIEGAVLLHEGEPVSKMLFIIRGNLDSYTTRGGQAGFFNSTCLNPGSFCGEELLTWALDPSSTHVLPASTRTVKAITKVEALALAPQDLKYIASQFKKLHSREIVHNFRFHSQQWRTWGACYIQAIWRRYKREKYLAQERSQDQEVPLQETDTFLPQPGSGLATYAAELVRRIRRGSSNRFGADSCSISLY